MVRSSEIAKEHNLKDDKTKIIKDLHIVDQALLEHLKTNMDKVEQNNLMINSSPFGFVTVDYELDILQDNEMITENRLKKYYQFWK